MKNYIPIFILFTFFIASCSKTENANQTAEKESTTDSKPKLDTLNDVTGTLYHLKNMASKYVDSRDVEVWLPPSYDENTDTKYPVIYMHDGQVLFERGRGYSGQEWEVDEWMTRLIKAGKVKEAIIVAPWNTAKRFREYQPNKPFQNLNTKEQSIRDSLDVEYNGAPLADEYLKFMVEELKPYIDSTYRTLSDKENTYMMGSSMGGLITIYAMAEYPDVYQKGACLSTHLPISLKYNQTETSDIIIRYLKNNLPDGSANEIYFDYGTKTLDSWYGPHQQHMDSVMVGLGYVHGQNWLTRKFEGAMHSEVSWRERLDVPLAFLIGIE